MSKIDYKLGLYVKGAARCHACGSEVTYYTDQPGHVKFTCPMCGSSLESDDVNMWS
jgi:predicted RNA-binding Zn-ribbon protein involved in translation (DUF1610 family)